VGVGAGPDVGTGVGKLAALDGILRVGAVAASARFVAGGGFRFGRTSVGANFEFG